MCAHAVDLEEALHDGDEHEHFSHRKSLPRNWLICSAITAYLLLLL